MDACSKCLLRHSAGISVTDARTMLPWKVVGYSAIDEHDIKQHTSTLQIGVDNISSTTVT
jgi:hypothetical protein